MYQNRGCRVSFKLGIIPNARHRWLLNKMCFHFPLFLNCVNESMVHCGNGASPLALAGRRLPLNMIDVELGLYAREH
jgi:hypothetical protein